MEMSQLCQTGHGLLISVFVKELLYMFSLNNLCGLFEIRARVFADFKCMKGTNGQRIYNSGILDSWNTLYLDCISLRGEHLFPWAEPSVRGDSCKYFLQCQEWNLSELNKITWSRLFILQHVNILLRAYLEYVLVLISFGILFFVNKSREAN